MSPLKVAGSCLEPEARDGDYVVVAPEADLEAGKFIVLWPMSGARPFVKRLRRVPPWRVEHPESDVSVLIEVETLNPPEHLAVPLFKLKAMHAVVAVIKGEERAA